MTTARVESEADPHMPGRTGYRIYGPTFESVADAIAVVRCTVDDKNGAARFFGPARLSEGWGAIGDVRIEQQEVA